MAFSWWLVAHAVHAETWMQLVVAHPTAAALALVLLAATAVVVTQVAGRLGMVVPRMTGIVSMRPCAGSRPRAALHVSESVMLASGHGSRAPGGGRSSSIRAARRA